MFYILILFLADLNQPFLISFSSDENQKNVENETSKPYDSSLIEGLVILRSERESEAVRYFADLSKRENKTIYEIGVDILLTHGANAGMEYFETLSITQNDLKSIFYLAWAYWQDDDLDQAESINRFVKKQLEDRPTNILNAHSSFLSAKLHAIRGEFDAALDDFQSATQLYKEKSSFGNLFVLTCSVASLYLDLNQTSDAERNLFVAREYYDFHVIKRKELGKQPRHLGYFYELEGHLHWQKKELELAIKKYEKSRQLYYQAGETRQAITQLNNIALIHLMLGEVKLGIEQTTEAEKKIRDAGYEDLSYYNTINWIFAYRCGKKTTLPEYNSMINDVSSWGKKRKDYRILKLLETVTSWKCH
ncbi:hypothetical protein SCOR_32770 [Sulfidibacter corallicola]|uniref:Tetratricopeptide repeat protein n=1 Tax=Sulfidibacter corallicola TaxID=2818388 RepID=A0A8A4TT23_SULCO|nr:hypothetical protein [Sulfidibacter corallicola]QTD49685.1 hypothetical protein J3U87_29225 [Sulfidibacter corallicola]